MISIENLTERNIVKKVFDSNENRWSRSRSGFSNAVQNKSNLVILIETTEGMKFGVYVKSEIDRFNKYVNDSHACIFKWNGNVIENIKLKTSKMQ